MQNPVKSNCFKGLYYLLNPLNLNMIRMHVLLTLLLRFLKLLTRRIFLRNQVLLSLVIIFFILVPEFVIQG